MNQLFIADSTKTIRLLALNFYAFGLRPHQLPPHRNLELVIELFS